MRKPSNRVLAVSSVVGVVAVVGIGTAAWSAADRDESRTATGVCGSATYELDLESEDGGLEATFELQSTAPGEVWEVVVEQDGAIVLRDERRTDEDGELDLDVRVAEAAQAIAVTATSPGAEPCAAGITR